VIYRSISLFGLALAMTLCLAAGVAQAADIGDVAPEFEGKDFINCDSISLKELRGRLILFELFSTG
jgi:hypothetical protein